jgi:hypothetical protein
MIPIFLFFLHPFSKKNHYMFISFFGDSYAVYGRHGFGPGLSRRRVRSTFSELQSLECPGPGDIAGCCCPPEAPLIVYPGAGLWMSNMMFTMQ